MHGHRLPIFKQLPLTSMLRLTSLALLLSPAAGAGLLAPLARPPLPALAPAGLLHEWTTEAVAAPVAGTYFAGTYFAAHERRRLQAEASPPPSPGRHSWSKTPSTVCDDIASSSSLDYQKA